MNEEYTKQTLSEVKDIFDEHGIDFWLDFGVLLGSIREKRFIPWDKDIDIASWTMPKTKIRKLLDSFLSKGFLVRYFKNNCININKRDCPISIALYDHDSEKAYTCWFISFNKVGHLINCLISVFSIYNPYKHLNNNRSIYIEKKMPIPFLIGSLIPYFCRNCIKKILQIIQPRIGNNRMTTVIPYQFVKQLKKIEFYNQEYLIPSQAEQLLNLKYEKWKTPNKNYNYESEDGTIFKKDVCPLCKCVTKPYLFGGYKCSSCFFKLD